MSGRPRLVIFDVDGTLVDSQATILGAMAAAFDGRGLPVPGRAEILSVVGLSLEQAMRRLAPDLPAEEHDALAGAYRAAYMAGRSGNADYAPLYPGARAALERLAGLPDVILGVATGKSRRGLMALFDLHDLHARFVTRQTADDHPSKPHPSMIRAAMAETGAAPGDTVMIGDTSYDMEMARAAGVTGIGVGWGYHPPHLLDCPHRIGDYADLPDTLGRIWDAAR